MQYNAKVSSQDEEPNMYLGVGGQLLWEKGGGLLEGYAILSN